jgi:hypothetical protein
MWWNRGHEQAPSLDGRMTIDGSWKKRKNNFHVSKALVLNAD